MNSKRKRAKKPKLVGPTKLVQLSFGLVSMYSLSFDRLDIKDYLYVICT
jgi:hypothetical protein